ncbi:MAG: leucine-rich repeat domain-containing protein [Christensenellaceae bacterium]
MKQRKRILLSMLSALFLLLSGAICTACSSSFGWVFHFSLNKEGTAYTLTGYEQYVDRNLFMPIPSSYQGLPVTAIGNKAMYNCKKLTGLSIPDSVTSIGAYAFAGCTALKSVTIPDSVTSLGEYAFYNCVRLKTATLPSGLTSIQEFTFCDCKSLTNLTIPDGVTSLGLRAFSQCDSLKSITIPGSVQSIGLDAFWDCSYLEQVTLLDGVQSIEAQAFYDCYRLKYLSLPESVTSVGKNAFHGCPCNRNEYDENGKYVASYLSSADNKHYILIEIHPFLHSFTIPEDTKIIASKTFFGTSLESVTLPDGLTHIGDYAFYLSSGLMSVTIPESVTSIGKYAFKDCTNLNSIEMGSKQDWSVYSADSAVTTRISEAVLSDPADSAYYLCDLYCGYTWSRS